LLAGIWNDVRRVAAALDIPERGDALLRDLQSRMQEISRQALTAVSRPRVACLEWLEPLMAAGNWTPELVEMAGGVNAFGAPGQHARALSWEELLAGDPDVIIAMPCGFDLERTKREMHWLTERARWSELKAVRDGRVYLADGNEYFNRPGPRIVESLRILAEILHPGGLPSLLNTGWMTL